MNCADFLSYCVMVHLLWPSRSYLYFNLKVPTRIPLEDLEFTGLMMSRDSTASASSSSCVELVAGATPTQEGVSSGGGPKNKRPQKLPLEGTPALGPDNDVVMQSVTPNSLASEPLTPWLGIWYIFVICNPTNYRIMIMMIFSHTKKSWFINYYSWSPIYIKYNLEIQISTWMCFADSDFNLKYIILYNGTEQSGNVWTASSNRFTFWILIIEVLVYALPFLAHLLYFKILDVDFPWFLCMHDIVAF